MAFRTGFSIYAKKKKVIGNFDKDCLESVDGFPNNINFSNP